MLHLEIAIAPDQVRNLADLNLLEARVGFEKGAILSRFPKNWYALVAQNLQGNAGHLDRVTDKLQRIKQSRLVGLGRPFDGHSWPAAAQQSHQTLPFHRIVDGINNQQPHFISDIQFLGDADFQYPSLFPRDAVNLAKAAAALLYDAEKVTIYDNYICPTKQGCLKTLSEIMTLCRKPAVEFHVFSEEDRKPPRTDRDQALNNYRKLLPANYQLSWYWVEDGGNGYLHHRGMYTGKGGLTYDRGFEEPNDHEQRAALTVITPMPITTLEEKVRVFNPAQLGDEISLVGQPWHSHN